MAAPTDDPQRRKRHNALLVGAVGALLIWMAAHGGLQTAPQPPPSAALARSVDGRGPLPASAPERVRIPAIGVDALTTVLGLAADGQIAVPSYRQADRIGWYRYSPAPGASGTTVLLGHVDTPTGRAVLYRLGQLRPGDHILIDRQDGSTAVFTVTRIAAYTDSAFPTGQVYSLSSAPELSLITCGNGYDSATHRYLGNIVAFARLTT
ncbi:class F sortase [Streptacidiphilus carbonis]|jgi:sortase (surface protein transpeptidase)|uniref:class F sortase n=1 Tax=Streptacidiphilus carbonis TaxID=105422 RepID=UPI000694389D|nr:class F sortase [Streptacidiphilus carbonis]